MTDLTLSAKIPSAKKTKAIAALLKLYPNTITEDDSTWTDPKNGSTAPQVAKYTDAQWINENYKRQLARDIHRGLQIKAQQDNAIEFDDSLVT